VTDVLVVDDGSQDGTRRAALSAGAIVEGFEHNHGKGAALQKGFSYALKCGYDYVITMDADGQHDPADLGKFVDRLDQYDLILGNRMDHASVMPVFRRLANIVSSRIVSVLSGRRIHDSQTGFRSYSARLLRGIHLSSGRFALESEVVIKAARRGLRI